MSAPSTFISHADEDALVAYELASHLERRGIACRAAPPDVAPGRDAAAAIERCGAFVLLLSSDANRSASVRGEAGHAASRRKPMFTVRIEDVAPAPALEFCISSSHRLDALRAPRDAAWERLAQAINRTRPVRRTGFGCNTVRLPHRPSRRTLVIAAAVGTLVAVAAIRLLGNDAADAVTGPRTGAETPLADGDADTSSPSGDLDRLIELGRRGALGERGEIGRDRPPTGRDPRSIRPPAAQPAPAPDEGAGDF